MLLASWLGDQFGSALCWMAFLVGVAVFCAKKFGNAHPEVKEAAKKVAAAKAIEYLGRILKK